MIHQPLEEGVQPGQDQSECVTAQQLIWASDHTWGTLNTIAKSTWLNSNRSLMGSNLKFILKRPQHDLMWHCSITVFLIWFLSVPKHTLHAQRGTQSFQPHIP